MKVVRKIIGAIPFTSIKGIFLGSKGLWKDVVEDEDENVLKGVKVTDVGNGFRGRVANLTYGLFIRKVGKGVWEIFSYRTWIKKAKS